jgi:hypothetical protein
MRTSGKGNDILIMVIPGIVLALFVLYLFGGPREFLKWLNTTIADAAEFVVSLF